MSNNPCTSVNCPIGPDCTDSCINRLIEDPVYPDAPGNPMSLSTNEYCNLLPRRRHSYQAKGKILLFPRTGLVGVPYDMTKGGGYNVVVVKGNVTYPVGGYHLSIGELEIVTALEVVWDASILNSDQVLGDWRKA